MVKEGWSALAAWRDVRMGEDGDLWHRAILDPSLLAVVGKVRGLHVLDLGCGNGYLTRRWASEGAAESLGVDATEANLRIARRRETRRRSGARFLRQDAAHLTSLESGRFDLVVAHMSLMDIRDAKNTILEVGRVLRPSGRFVFSISHPCFDVDLRSKWVVERVPYRATVYRSVAGYREEHPVRIPWKISESEVAYSPVVPPSPTDVRGLPALGRDGGDPTRGADAAGGGDPEERAGPLHARDPAPPRRRGDAGAGLARGARAAHATGVAKLGTYSGGGRPTIGIAWPHARHRFCASRFQAWIVNP